MGYFFVVGQLLQDGAHGCPLFCEVVLATTGQPLGRRAADRCVVCSSELKCVLWHGLWGALCCVHTTSEASLFFDDAGGPPERCWAIFVAKVCGSCTSNHLSAGLVSGRGPVVSQAGAVCERCRFRTFQVSIAEKEVGERVWALMSERCLLVVLQWLLEGGPGFCM